MLRWQEHLKQALAPRFGGRTERFVKRLQTYLKGYKKECVLAPAFKLLEASFELFVPLVVASMIDAGIGGADADYVWRMGGLMVLLGLTGFLCTLTAQFFAAKAAVGFAAKLRQALYAHIQTLSYAALDKLGASTLITRLTSDINQVQSGVNMLLRLFLRSPFIVFGAMLMAFTVDVRAAVVFVITIPLLCIVVFGIMYFSIPLFGRVQQALDRVLGLTRENLSGVRVIRAFGREEQELADFDARSAFLQKAQLLAGRVSAFMNPLTYIIINGAAAALIWYGAVRVDTGALTQGQVVALLNYMSQILVELVKLANLIITITKSVACGRRICQVLDTASGMAYGALEQVGDSHPYAVELCHAGLAYNESADEALTDVNLQIRRGETVGMIGATGAGKSSLVNLIARFYDATSGQVLLNGTDIRQFSQQALRRHLAVVPQKAVLFRGTVRENLLWGREDALEQELLEALELAQAKAFVLEKEGGLDAAVEQNGRNFSGGQRQRLTIARALVKKSPILILDDSASALDLATEAALRRAIRTITPRPTILIVSQRASSVRFADRIVVLDDGCVAGTGTHEELLQGCAVYREIYESQERTK